MTGVSALPREMQLLADRSVAATLDEDRLDGLDQLCRLMLNPDPRSRMSDWTVVRDEIHAVLRRIEGAPSEVPIVDNSSLEALVPSLKKLSKARPEEPYRRAQHQEEAERASCRELTRAFVDRLHSHLDDELTNLAPVLDEAGLSVSLSTGGLYLKNVVKQFAPLRGQGQITNLRRWAGEHSTMAALHIRGTRPPWSPSIWVGEYLVPQGSDVAVTRVTTCQHHEHDRQAFVAGPGRYWDLSPCGRWDLATSTDRVLGVADTTASFLRDVIREYVTDSSTGIDPGARYLGR